MTDIEKMQLKEIDGYQMHFALNTNGQCILCDNFAYTETSASTVLFRFLELKKKFKKEGNILKDLSGMTIYDEKSTIITLFTGKPGKRILLCLFLDPAADINKVKYTIFSIFEE